MIFTEIGTTPLTNEKLDDLFLSAPFKTSSAVSLASLGFQELPPLLDVQTPL